MIDTVLLFLAGAVTFVIGWTMGYRRGYWAGALKEFRRWRLIPLRHERWKRIIERSKA